MLKTKTKIPAFKTKIKKRNIDTNAIQNKARPSIQSVYQCGNTRFSMYYFECIILCQLGMF